MNLLRRVIAFYRRHGLRSTGARCLTALQRFTSLGRMVLFSCPLPLAQMNSREEFAIERVDSSSLSKIDFARMLDVWNPENRAREMTDRFAVGSTLWLTKVEGKLAGFGWTVIGRTIEPHFFPLKSDEVHLFDFFVFPAFRGRGINVALVTGILAQLSNQQLARAHIDCAIWNHAQIRSLGKTPFRQYAEVTKVALLGQSKIIWHRGAPLV